MSLKPLRGDIIPMKLYFALKPHNPGPGDDYLKQGILAMEVSGAFVFIGRIEGGIFYKTVV